MSKIIDVGKEKDREEEKFSPMKLLGLLNPKNLANMTKKIAEETTKGMINKKLVITQIENGYLVEMVAGMQNRIVFKKDLPGVIEKIKLWFGEK